MAVCAAGLPGVYLHEVSGVRCLAGREQVDEGQGGRHPSRGVSLGLPGRIQRPSRGLLSEERPGLMLTMPDMLESKQ